MDEDGDNEEDDDSLSELVEESSQAIEDWGRMLQRLDDNDAHNQHIEKQFQGFEACF